MTKTGKVVYLKIPEEDYLTITETLQLDSESSAFDPDLRKEIRSAIGNMQELKIIEETYEDHSGDDEDEEEESEIDNFSVTVGNIGTIYDGESLEDAQKIFKDYIEASKSDYGRASGESVYLFRNDEIFEEYIGKLDDHSEE